MLSIISNLLRSLAAYWELKHKRFEHDLREQSRSRIEALTDELEKLRSSGTAFDALTADRVRDRVATELAYFKSIPKPSSED